ncbi:MAG: hypothetical protein OXT67_10555 [Zetaproteobacteria bacterium]|nr:hypothetical protein [Zetaproteobacteria bacterium]
MRRQWYGLVVGCWLCSSVLTAHPLGDFFHQHGRKLLAGVGAVLGVSSVAVVGFVGYAAHSLDCASRALAIPPALDSGATVCSAPQEGGPCGWCQEYSPGWLSWPTARALIQSAPYSEVAYQLVEREDATLPLTELLEMLLHSPQADALEVAKYFPRWVRVTRVQLHRLLELQRYALLTQRFPGLEQVLAARFGICDELLELCGKGQGDA